MAKKERAEFDSQIDDIDMIAKKDFVIVQNDIKIVIKQGDKVNVPEQYIQNLIIEGVI